MSKVNEWLNSEYLKLKEGVLSCETVPTDSLTALLEDRDDFRFALENIISLHSHSSYCNYNEDNGWECSYSTAELIALDALSVKK